MSALTPPPVVAYLTRLTRAARPLLDRIRDEGHAAGVPIVDTLTGARLHALTRSIAATRAPPRRGATSAKAAWTTAST